MLGNLFGDLLRGPRHYWRCIDCLQVGAASERPAAMQCADCGGTLEYMGRVQADRLVREEERCPCDHRCTGAIGPNCECKCGGENHGTRRMMTVLRDGGPVPRARFGGNRRLAAALAAEYRAAVQAVIGRATRGEVNGWVAQRAIRKARESREHATRLRILRAVAEAEGVLCV